MSEKKSKIFLLGSEGCGQGDSDLGFKILFGLLSTLSDRNDKPEAIIFWNTAVNLIADGSPMIPHLKRLEEKGIKLLVGKLCVNELGLVGKISVGKVVSLSEILDLILSKDVVSL